MRWKTHRRLKHVPTINSYRIKKLLDFFSDYKRTDDIFTFLRLVTAIWMCSHSEEFKLLVPELSESYTLSEWCFKEVIQRRVFSDHVQIRALLMALGVPLRVEYLTHGPGQDLYTVQDHEVPHVTLLYVPEHYDILYPHRGDDFVHERAVHSGYEDPSLIPVGLKVPFDIKSLEQEWMKIRPSGVMPAVCGEEDHRKSFWNKLWRRAACTGQNLQKMGPLVSEKPIPITMISSHCDLMETTNGSVCASNALKLSYSYTSMRTVRKDGECFYRSFIFSYLEQVLKRQDTYEEHRLLADVNTLYRQHTLLRWSSEFSRTCRAFKNLIKKVMRWKKKNTGRWPVSPSQICYRREKLLKFFNNYQRSSYVLAFLRLAAAVYICSHSEEFGPLVPDLKKGLSLRDWCFIEIIQMKVFIDDDIQMKALARALGVPLRVEYLSGEACKDLYTLATLRK